MSIPIPSASKSGEIICRDARVIVFPFFDANINQREERKSGSAGVERGRSAGGQKRREGWRKRERERKSRKRETEGRSSVAEEIKTRFKGDGVARASLS